MTDTTRFSEMLHLVRPNAPTAPEDLMVNALRQAAIQFCDETHYWLYDHDPITTLADIATYDLDAPCDGIVCRVVQAHFESRLMKPVSLDQIAQIYGTRWEAATGDPMYYLQDNYRELIVVPCPTERTANAIRLRLAVKPSQASEDIDTDVYDQWGEVLAHGALARIYGVPGQMYSDEGQSAKYWAMFTHGVGRGKIERNRSLTRNRPKARPGRGYL